MEPRTLTVVYRNRFFYLLGLILLSTAAVLVASSVAQSPSLGGFTNSLCHNSSFLLEAQLRYFREMLQTGVTFTKSFNHRSKRPGNNTLNAPFPKQTANTGFPFRQDSSSSCSPEICSATSTFAASSSSTPSIKFSRPNVTTKAVVKDKKWWKQGADIWIEANSEKDYFNEIQSGDKPVFVDFYATWCHGCEKSFPEICKMIKADPELKSKFKFVKVCVDGLRSLVKSQGIHSLPYVIIFQPGRGKLVSLNMPVSRVKNLKHNLQVLLLNPGMDFTVDPNGFILPSEPHINSLHEKGKSGASHEKSAHAAASASRTWATPAGQHPIASPASQPLHLQQMHDPGTDISSIVGNLSHSRMAQQQQFGLPASHAPVLATSPANLGSTTAAAALNSASAVPSATAPTPSAATSPQIASPPSPGPIRLVRLPVKGVNDERYMTDKLAFLKHHHAEYGYGGKIDELYPREVGCRMQPHEHYVDYTGASVYCQSQLEAAFQELRQHMFGNPHSENPSSSLTSELVEDVRDRLLRFFNADPREYQLVFTRSATGALQLVGETFPWSKRSVYRYLRENHNSVLGVREYALQAGAAYEAVDELFVEQWLKQSPGHSVFDNVEGKGTLPDIAALSEGHQECVPGPGHSTTAPASKRAAAAAAASSTKPSSAAASSKSSAAATGKSAPRGTVVRVISGNHMVEVEAPPNSTVLAQDAKGSATENATVESGDGEEVTYSLFAFPGEENFSGIKYPLKWARKIQARSTPRHRWLTMIDAAAYVPSQPLDMAKVQADFVTMSFYKMFGYPTGLGALLVKTTAVPLMKKVFWGGGTVSLATSERNFHVFKCRPSDKLEDGTLGFLDIVSLKHGLKVLDTLGGMRKVQSHVHCLTAWAFHRMAALRHSNGAPVLAIFGKHGSAHSREVQGGIINFLVLRPDGTVFSYKKVEREAAARGFHLRTGTGCNPGAGYNCLGVTEVEVQSLAGSKEGCHDDVEFLAVQRPANVSNNAMLLRSIANVAQGVVPSARPTLVHVSLDGAKRCDGSAPKDDEEGAAATRVDAPASTVETAAASTASVASSSSTLSNASSSSSGSSSSSSSSSHSRRSKNPVSSLSAASSSSSKEEDETKAAYYSDKSGKDSAGGEAVAAAATKTVQVPLGSIRVSFGYMSTFEDVFALTEWIEKTYTDRY